MLDFLYIIQFVCGIYDLIEAILVLKAKAAMLVLKWKVLVAMITKLCGICA